MNSSTPSTAAFLLSLLGGIIIIVGACMSIFFYSNGWPYGGMMGNWGWMMGMGGHIYGGNLLFAFSVIGLISGIIVVISAIMLNVLPREQTAWAILILIFSIISFLDMGGFMIGALLGIAGGALALAYRMINKNVSKL